MGCSSREAVNIEAAFVGRGHPPPQHVFPGPSVMSSSRRVCGVMHNRPYSKNHSVLNFAGWMWTEMGVLVCGDGKMCSYLSMVCLCVSACACQWLVSLWIVFLVVVVC